MRGDSSSPSPNQVLTKRRLQDLLHEIDPREQMDDDVEDVSLNFFFLEGWRVSLGYLQNTQLIKMLVTYISSSSTVHYSTYNTILTFPTI